jgi:chromosome segregation protein
MRIKRIDLLGFKSFGDKVSLDFQRAITGIVGPNGCGKSNVVDALRWAMGEQSARHLRGKSMEDVIFNGSDTRGPSGMAEVSITFDNDGRVPVEFLEFSEITVSRRLHRDGTSEYLINMVPCRLRDITNLFLGTGVGTKAYSIIEQGRIGLIVSARPEDRRHFIEEAAGITKYQRRKRAAERKMEATRQNLLRVSDVLEEISKRLGSLRRQAKKAERYKAYREEMQDIELWSASHRLLELMAEGRYQDEVLVDLERRQEESHLDLERREADLEAARMQAMEVERKVNTLNEHLYALDNRVKLNENTIKFHGHEADELELRAQEARADVEQLRRQVAESDATLLESRRESEQWAGRRSGLADEVLVREEILAGLREEHAEVLRAVEQEREGIALALNASARAEASLRALQQRRKDVQERGDRQRDEIRRVLDGIATAGSAASELNGELDGLRDSVAQLGQRRADAVERLETLTEEAKRGETELEVIRTELHRRRSRLTSLKEIQQRYEGFSRGTRAIMKKREETGEEPTQETGILGLVADAVEAPEAYETALEAVLGQRLGTVIVEDDKVGLEAIAYLKNSAEGRSSFIARFAKKGGLLAHAPVGFIWEPPSVAAELTAGGGAQPGGIGGLWAGPAGVSMPTNPGVHGPILNLINFNNDYHSVAESLLGDVMVVDTLENALGLWERAGERTLVTLEGEILEPDGTVTGGSQDAELSGVLRQKREVKELTEIIVDLEQQYQSTLDAHVSVKTEIASLQQILEAVTRDGHQGDKDIITHEKDLSRVDSELQTLTSRRVELERETEHVRRLLDELEQQETQLLEEVTQAAVDQHLGQDLLYLLGRETERLVGLTEAAATSLTDLRVELAQAEATYQAMAENVRRIEELRQDKLDRITRLDQDSTEGLRRADELRRQVDELHEEQRGLVTERSDCQDRLEQGRTSYEHRLAEVGELEVELKQVRSKVGELGVQVGKIQLKLSENNMEHGHLHDQIWERYREELSRVAGDYHMRSPVTEEQIERMERLRQLIQRMGEINLTAIEEFEELDERYEFLSTHKQDLEGALGQLQRAIQKINRTSRKRFRETFELVNAKFQVVFPRLFKGGRARLQLTDPDNLLESGVDIIAQPPGKKLQSIDLLSGGEKALTAVSLIFSMFLVKPTPFCLLDEVDAPLDEANVRRFNEIVRETSEISQFILITHNRQTMEIVDRLYGVTMEEPGISKLVSVSLGEGQEYAA